MKADIAIILSALALLGSTNALLDSKNEEKSGPARSGPGGTIHSKTGPGGSGPRSGPGGGGGPAKSGPQTMKTGSGGPQTNSQGPAKCVGSCVTYAAPQSNRGANGGGQNGAQQHANNRGGGGGNSRARGRGGDTGGNRNGANSGPAKSGDPGGHNSPSSTPSLTLAPTFAPTAEAALARRWLAGWLGPAARAPTLRARSLARRQPASWADDAGFQRRETGWEEQVWTGLEGRDAEPDGKDLWNRDAEPEDQEYLVRRVADPAHQLALLEYILSQA